MCLGVKEALACGTRIPKSDCIVGSTGGHAAFAREHCPVMCGEDCTAVLLLEDGSIDMDAAVIKFKDAAGGAAGVVIEAGGEEYGVRLV
jgi:hypothetical protein